MTFQWCNILAADDNGTINILVLVVMLVIGLVGHLIKKAQEKREVEEANRKVEQAKRRHTAAETSSEYAQTEPPPVPTRSPFPAVETRQQMPVIHAATALGQGVGQEVLQVKKQLAAKERQQHQRLVGAKPLRPTIGTTAARAEGVSSDERKIHLNLTDTKAAKTAIICAEVLGPPKSLRTNPEPWDM